MTEKTLIELVTTARGERKWARGKRRGEEKRGEGRKRMERRQHSMLVCNSDGAVREWTGRIFFVLSFPFIHKMNF